MGILIIGCLLGVLFGVLLQRLFGSSPQSDDLAEENEALRAEIETLRSQVDGHFATSAVMFKNLTEEYRKLLEHMADGARSLDVELPNQLLADFSDSQTAPQLAEPAEQFQAADPDTAGNIPHAWEASDPERADDNPASQRPEDNADQGSTPRATDP